MPISAFARLMPEPAGPVPFGSGEQHPVFHFPGTSLVLNKPVVTSSFTFGPSNFTTAHRLALSSGVRFGSSHQEQKHPQPGPGYYDYATPTPFDTAGKRTSLSPFFEARRTHMLSSSSKPDSSLVSGSLDRLSRSTSSATDDRTAPYRKEPVTAPSPVRYAPLSRFDMCNIAGPPALLFERHSAQARSALTSASASGLGSLPATRLYSVHRARVHEVAPDQLAPSLSSVRGLQSNSVMTGGSASSSRLSSCVERSQTLAPTAAPFPPMATAQDSRVRSASELPVRTVV